MNTLYYTLVYTDCIAHQACDVIVMSRDSKDMLKTVNDNWQAHKRDNISAHIASKKPFLNVSLFLSRLTHNKNIIN